MPLVPTPCRLSPPVIGDLADVPLADAVLDRPPGDPNEGRPNALKISLANVWLSGGLNLGPDDCPWPAVPGAGEGIEAVRTVSLICS